MSNANFFRFASLSLLLCIAGNAAILNAQTSFEEYKRKAQQEFEEYRTKQRNEFEAYRERVNKEFADYMSKAWPEFKTEPAMPAPAVPEPPLPEVAPPDQKPSNEPFPFSKVTPIPKVPEKPVPLLPQPNKDTTPGKSPKPTIDPVKPSASQVSFNYYGKKCDVPFSESLRFSLRGADENNVAQGWKHLSGDESVATVRKCIELRDNMRLSDWGYLRLVEKLADAVFPGKRNESRLLQMFLLTQSGYKVRIGRQGENLVILVPCDEVIYNYRYIPMNGTKYYVTDRAVGSGSTHIFNRAFPGEKMFSLIIPQQPELALEPSQPRNFKSTFNPSIDLNVSVNKNLIDFYNEYPLSSHWNLYANASLSDNVKNQVYPKLKDAIAGKDDVEATGILLHFVQTAFDYKTDEEQFGIERSFFPDETFSYPFCDCEDRAILFAMLVKELLSLDTVLIHYPGHLASAVKFNGDVSGDYFNINGEKYIVCDPTYINAGVGMAMRQYKDSSAEIIRL